MKPGGTSVTSAVAFAALPISDPESGDFLAVMETPKGSRNKYGYNEKLGVFELRKVLPRGMIFPYDFGFLPSTEGADGDPLDVLLLLDEPAPMGCVIRVRVVGAIEAEQREKGDHWMRNDRLIAVATHAQLHGNVESLKEINPRVLDEIEAFFGQYNQMQGKEFRVVDRCGPKAALKLIEEGKRKRSKADKT
jgi:inorganic pyrophosphatase